LKVCFKGTSEEISTLRNGLETATGSAISLDKGNCISEHHPTGATGFKKLQQILGTLVASDETYTVLFGNEDKHLYSYYDQATRTAGILRSEIGRAWYVGGSPLRCRFGGSARPFYSLPALLGHELLGHGSGQTTERGAIQVENLVHGALGEVPRCLPQR